MGQGIGRRGAAAAGTLAEDEEEEGAALMSREPKISSRSARAADGEGAEWFYKTE